MSRKERVRVATPGVPTSEYWAEKVREGWSLVAVEWERDLPDDVQEELKEEAPYGLMVDKDCLHLIENPREFEVLTLMRELIISDKSLSEVASVMNEKGYRNRGGGLWTQIEIYNLIPRQVETAKRIHRVEHWPERRRAALKIVG